MVSMQISLTLVGGVGGSPIDATVNNLAKLRDEGFRRIWMTQMPFDGDLLTVLAVVMREVDTIEVGSAVLPIQNQHPMLLAQRALMLNVIAGGRFVLGLGMTHQAVTEGMWGIPYDKPVRRMREYLDGLQPLLAGQAADAIGETVTTRGALADSPVRGRPDVYLAALGPQMLRLAGGSTAGTLTWMCGAQDAVGSTSDQRCERRPRKKAARRRRCGSWPACRCASPTMSRERGHRQPSSCRCIETAGLPRHARPGGARESRGPRHHRRRADGVRSTRRAGWRSASTSSPPSSSTPPRSA